MNTKPLKMRKYPFQRDLVESRSVIHMRVCLAWKAISYTNKLLRPQPIYQLISTCSLSTAH